jgi:hypothetical protein
MSPKADQLPGQAPQIRVKTTRHLLKGGGSEPVIKSPCDFDVHFLQVPLRLPDSMGTKRRLKV